MAKAGEVREMWSWEGDDEPVLLPWSPWSSAKSFRRGSQVRYEGATIFATRAAAIRHAIAEAKRDREVMAKAAAEIAEKVARLTALIAEEA